MNRVQSKKTNLQIAVARLALSPNVSALTLRRMVEAYVKGKRESSEAGREIYEQKKSGK